MGQLGLDSLGGIAGQVSLTAQPRQVNLRGQREENGHNMTAKTGHLAQNNLDRKTRAGQPGQDRIAGTGQRGQFCLDRSAWTEQRGHNDENMTART